MDSVVSMDRLGYWTDQCFGYDIDYDFARESYDIERQDGKLLRCVSWLNSQALYSVHFCVDAHEIWVIDLVGLRKLAEFERGFIRYSPNRKADGLPSARGYCFPCSRLLEIGHRWDMPPKLAARLDGEKTKAAIGKTAEKAFAWLVNEKKFFPIFAGMAKKAEFNDDYLCGIDFWIGEPSAGVSVQVKVDGPGGEGSGCTGNLFFQTHTLPAADAENWYGFNRSETEPQPIRGARIWADNEFGF